MKLTKIVATISDLKCETEFIRELYKAGMNVVRLNTAHQSVESSKKIIENVRLVSDRLAILIDTKGPELRTCKVVEEFKLMEGDEIMLKGDPERLSNPDCIYVMYKEIVRDVPLHSKLLIDDGHIELLVTAKKDDYLLCRAMNSGVIQSKKSINVPDVKINLPALSLKDREYVEFAIEQDVDFIAHSFVRNKQDILEIQQLLDEKKSNVKIIAKIENQEGVDNIDEILECVYGVMVARGDLAIEIPYERIPVIQRDIINKCIEIRKPVIIATQMLHSMIKNPRPTRAEVSDIASAVYSNADAIMLSNETAGGDYPVEAVRTMAKIALEIEKHKKTYHNADSTIISSDISAYLTKSAVKAAIRLEAKAIVADTRSGRTIRNMTGFRGIKPIFSFCYNKRTMRELALSYGVFSEFLKPRGSTREYIHESLHILIKKGHVTEEDRIVLLAGNFGTDHGASYIEISTVQNLLNPDNLANK